MKQGEGVRFSSEGLAHLRSPFPSARRGGNIFQLNTFPKIRPVAAVARRPE